MLVYSGDIPIMNALLAADADVNYGKNELFRTPALHECCKYGYKDIAIALINAEAELNTVDQQETPLEICIRRNHDDIATILRDAGAALR